MPIPSYIQQDFRGGMNVKDQNISIGPDEYCLAFNVRNRTTALETIKAPVKDEDIPHGLKQGIYAFDRYVLVFCNGKAYYKNIVTNSAWIKIANFYCDTAANYVYAEVVPGSTLNYAKKLLSAEKIDGTVAVEATTLTNITINGTPAGLVVQDGTYQPWIILPDATARRTQTFVEWSLANREYVPIMKQMKYINGILFGVDARDGRTLLRSVSGRPLDFVINVDVEGNKGGDAYTTSYAVSYDPITCLQSLSSGELLASTLKTCYPIEFVYDQKIFGEPKFTNNKSFSAGINNQFSFVDTLGDYCFIDTDGIRSFNAVNNQQNEGRNSILSRNIDPLLAIKQDITAAIVFDNFVFFAIKTQNFGYCIAVADLTRLKLDSQTQDVSPSWVCFDKFPSLDGPIKQFAIADQSENPVLYAITADSVYRLYSSSDTLEGQVDFRAVTTGEAKSEIRLSNIRGVFDYSFTEAIAVATEIVDNNPNKSVSETLGSARPNQTYGEVDNINFNFQNLAKQGWKVQPRIQWSNESKLQLVEMDCAVITRNTSLRQMSKNYANT